MPFKRFYETLIIMEKYVFCDGFDVPYIASRQNARVISASKLSDKKHREKTGLFLCEGIKLTLEAARYGSLSEVYLRESDAENYRYAVDTVLEAGAEVFVISDSAFDKITTEKAPQGIISTAFAVDSADFSADEDSNVLLLDCVRDPGNLGTILRSAAALGNVTVALHSCADVYNPKTVRAAMGAIFKTRILKIDNCVEFVKNCKNTGRRVLAAALTDDSLKLGKYETKKSDVIVIGNEGHGISEEIIAECTSSLMIPMKEGTESLNASVAASVILWEYAR